MEMEFRVSASGVAFTNAISQLFECSQGTIRRDR
jgi:DeoR/GlpR family transcriptional regulator of sugar metabolism